KQLIEDLMSVYKLDLHVQFSFSETNFQDLVDDVASELSPIIADRTISIEKHYYEHSAESSPPVSKLVVCDKLRIKQVLVNLIKNAVDFVPSHDGKISITLEDKKIDSIPPEMRNVMSSSSGNILLVSVSDNGIGIPAEKVPNLFRKFYQVDPKATRRYGGTGLGLTICKGIVEGHGGRIWYDLTATKTVAGTGACFRFYLPHEPPNAHEIPK